MKLLLALMADEFTEDMIGELTSALEDTGVPTDLIALPASVVASLNLPKDTSDPGASLIRSISQLQLIPLVGSAVERLLKKENSE